MATLHENDDDQDTSNEEHVEVENEKPAPKTEDEVEVIEDNGGDERIAQADDEEHEDTDEGDKPRRQRETAAERRARAKFAKERDKKELNFQRNELARQDRELQQLRETLNVSRVNDLDSRISTANNEAAQFDRIFAAAITAKNGEDARQAAEYRDAAKTRAWQLDQERQRLAQEAKQPRNQAPPYQVLAEDFMSANPWYDHTGRDADSRLVKEIDAAVAKEYIPTSPAYWAELQRRVEKNLPHKFESRRQQRNDDEGDDDTQQEQAPARRRGPPTGGSSRSNSSTSTQIRLSPERVQAMKDAGLWEDPKTRTKMAKQYANYDKQNQRG